MFRLPPFFANIQKRLIKTPKLYFTEPGLAAWLLQIESAEQAARDPLLGGLFENMVIVEALKGAYNRGLEPRLSFYRDRTGLEIDLIREYHRRPFAVEIKASGTFTREMLRNIHRLRELLPDREGEGLIYSGEDERRIDGVSLIPFTKTARLLFGSTTQGP